MPAYSTRPGMGAIPFSGGITFRTWAPFAMSVSVAGDFNTWSSSATPLVAEGNGNWSVDVAGTAVGAEYKFVVNGAWHIDPRAKHVTNSVGNGVVVDPNYNWS